MKKIELGQAVSILANIGILAGLILVAIQINQSTQIAKAQLENDYHAVQGRSGAPAPELAVEAMLGWLAAR